MNIYKSYYKILKHNFCLETPSKEENDFCDFMLQEFLGKGGSADISLIKVVDNSKKKGYYSIYKNGEIAIEWGGKLQEVHYAILTKALENIVIGHATNLVDKKEMITLHSGAVSRDNKGILILGEGGNGKSTLTLELVANHQWLYLTDEVGLLDANHVIHPFLKTISYKCAGVVKLYDQWPMRQFGIDQQIAVPPEKHGKPVPLKAVFFVKYSPDKEPTIESIKKSDSLVHLLNSQIGKAKSVATVEQMAMVVKKVNSYQIFHNNATEASRLITELIKTI